MALQGAEGLEPLVRAEAITVEQVAQVQQILFQAHQLRTPAGAGAAQARDTLQEVAVPVVVEMEAQVSIQMEVTEPTASVEAVADREVVTVPSHITPALVD